MSLLYTIICVLGSVASILGVALSLKKQSNSSLNIVLYSLLFVLSVLAALFYYRYKTVTDKQLDYENRKQQAREEARAILNTLPPSASTINAGDNKGIVYSTMFFLEQNKSLWPDSYESFKKESEQVMQQYNERSTDYFSYISDRMMESTANEALRILKTLTE